AVVHRIENATLCLAQRDATPLPPLPQLAAELLTIGRRGGVDELEILERERRVIGLAANGIQIAEQNGAGDAVIGENARGAQNARIIAFREYDAGRILLCPADQAAHDLPLRPKPGFQLGAILLDVDDAPRDARRDRGPRDGRRD